MHYSLYSYNVEGTPLHVKEILVTERSDNGYVEVHLGQQLGGQKQIHSHINQDYDIA